MNGTQLHVLGVSVGRVAKEVARARWPFKQIDALFDFLGQPPILESLARQFCYKVEPRLRRPKRVPNDPCRSLRLLHQELKQREEDAFCVRPSYYQAADRGLNSGINVRRPSDRSADRFATWQTFESFHV